MCCGSCIHFMSPKDDHLTDDEREELLEDNQADGWCNFHSYPVEHYYSCYRFVHFDEGE